MLPTSTAGPPLAQPGSGSRLQSAGSSSGGRLAGIEIEEEEPLAPRPRAAMARRASTTQQAVHSVVSSYFSRRFMSGGAILLPIVLTLYLTFFVIEFFDGFFSPIYQYLFGFHVFGLGFITSMLFIFATGVFTSSWIGSVFVGMGESIMRKVPLVKHIYSAAKQVSAAVNPGNEATHSFRECVIIRHPRQGEYAFGFITGSTTLQTAEGDLELFTVYVPTNHVYVGDVFLLGEKDIIRSNLSVREGIEIVVSVGMAVPPRILQLATAKK